MEISAEVHLTTETSITETSIKGNSKARTSITETSAM